MIKLTEKQIQNLILTQTNCFEGYYNKNFKIKYRGVPYILRAPIKDAISMDMRFIAEEDILNFLNNIKVKINIPLVEMNEVYKGQKFFLHNYIQGNTIEDVYSESCEMPNWIIEKNAETMIELHNIPLTEMQEFVNKMPWRIDTKEFYNYIYKYNKDLIEKYKKDYGEIYELFGMPNDIDDFVVNQTSNVVEAKFVLAHSDIHRKNIIIDESIQKTTLIDWELALIAPSFYDISIHFHKMRYEAKQENLFLDKICVAAKTDKNFTKQQIKLYRDIEEVKSVAIDLVRYLSILNEISEKQIISNAKRYFSKLYKAYVCWGKDPDSISMDYVISFFLNSTNKDFVSLVNHNKSIKAKANFKTSHE